MSSRMRSSARCLSGVRAWTSAMVWLHVFPEAVRFSNTSGTGHRTKGPAGSPLSRRNTALSASAWEHRGNVCYFHSWRWCRGTQTKPLQVHPASYSCPVAAPKANHQTPPYFFSLILMPLLYYGQRKCTERNRFAIIQDKLYHIF